MLEHVLYNLLSMRLFPHLMHNVYFTDKSEIMRLNRYLLSKVYVKNSMVCLDIIDYTDILDKIFDYITAVDKIIGFTDVIPLDPSTVELINILDELHQFSIK